MIEKTTPELWKALLWRSLLRAGHPGPGSELGLWDILLIGMIKEMENARDGDQES